MRIINALSILYISGIGLSPKLQSEAANDFPEKQVLKWQSPLVERQIKANDVGADAVFSFKNIADKSVKILNVESSCGCTVGKPEKGVYAPGESGEVRAHFKTSGRRGKQVIWITVITDSDAAPSRLQLNIDIQDIMTLSPRFLLWKRSEDTMSAKEIEIRFTGAGKVGGIEAVSTSPAVMVTTEPTTDPALWKLVITPAASLPNGVIRTEIAIKAQTETAGILQSRVFVQVR